MRFILWGLLMIGIGVIRLFQTPAWLYAKARGRAFKWFTPSVQ